ncbi:MAG: DUF2892 domain-containing protein [Thiobacillus sp.]|jgi:hypothetical protein|uniref:YgaP family membrane protein n=1 Tax=Thiobacillus sp. TaxID=924 RepID=UPI0028939C2A|nr:DUF2892 domain-containing protein [Thiobacillus sp.]MDT3707783.1 DUF2892 domain-containing protein [Thiobacillus sp.]
MTVDKIIRLVVGLGVAISVLLMHYHNPAWGWVAGIMGLSLAQSAFTNTCPLSFTLRKLGVSDSNCAK